MKIIFCNPYLYRGMIDYGIYNFYEPLKDMGHEVVFYDLHSRRVDKLYEMCQDFEPDLIFSIITDMSPSPDQWKCITDMGITNFNWFADDSYRFGDFSHKFSKSFTHIATCHEPAAFGHQSLGAKNILVTNWCANDKLYKYQKLEKKYDVTLIGELHTNRPKFIEELEKRGIRVNHFFGISFEEMIKVINESKILLCFMRDKIYLQFKARIFEYAACNAFMLVERYEPILQYFPDYIHFQYPDDLAEKIKYYLANDWERNRNASMCYDRFIRNHTSEIRLKQVFKFIELSKEREKELNK